MDKEFLKKAETYDDDDTEIFLDLSNRAEAGDAEAQCKLGEMYYLGDSVPENYEKAFEWFIKAANQGNAKTSYTLGDMHYYARGVPEDYEKAYEWYSKAKGQGHAYARCKIGRFFQA